MSARMAASANVLAFPMAANCAATQSAPARMAASVREATISDVYTIAANMREKDAEEARALGRRPKRALRISFGASLMRPRVAEVDGTPAAIWGLGGAILSDVGYPWLVTTPAVERVPVTVLRVARAELARMLTVKPRLENIVAADYRGAIRLLEVLGFVLDPPVRLKPHGALFRRFWMDR